MTSARRADCRRGQVLVLSPVLFLAVLAVLALAVDVGRIVVEKSRVQNGSDAACLAAVEVLLQQYSQGSGEADARSAATDAAGSIFAQNVPSAALDLQFGTWAQDGSFAPVGTDARASVVRAAGARDEGAPGGRLAFFFAPILGVNSCDVSAMAASELDGRVLAVYGGLAPFAVPEDSIPAVGQEFAFYPGNGNGNGNGHGGEQTSPGNWGLLNLDGGSENTPDLINWIENGYPGTVEIDADLGYVWIEGNPGWRAALEASLQQKIGQPLTVCVYDQVTGQGANTQYRIKGFLRLTLTYADLTGQDAEVRGRVEELESLHGIKVGTGGWESPNMVKIQLAR